MDKSRLVYWTILLLVLGLLFLPNMLIKGKETEAGCVALPDQHYYLNPTCDTDDIELGGSTTSYLLCCTGATCETLN